MWHLKASVSAGIMVLSKLVTAIAHPFKEGMEVGRRGELFSVLAVPTTDGNLPHRRRHRHPIACQKPPSLSLRDNVSISPVSKITTRWALSLRPLSPEEL